MLALPILIAQWVGASRAVLSLEASRLGTCGLLQRLVSPLGDLCPDRAPGHRSGRDLCPDQPRIACCSLASPSALSVPTLLAPQLPVGRQTGAPYKAERCGRQSAWSLTRAAGLVLDPGRAGAASGSLGLLLRLFDKQVRSRRLSSISTNTTCCFPNGCVGKPVTANCSGSPLRYG